MDDFFFVINPIENKIINAPQKMGINWKNICTIRSLSTEELYDLSWAGHEGVGFVKACGENKDIIQNLNCDPDILILVKNTYKKIISEKRKEKESFPILVEGKFLIQLTEKCKLHMLMKYIECISNEDLSFNWKSNTGPIKFTAIKFILLYKKIQSHIQNLFDKEIEIHNQIDECQDIKSLMNVELDINCNFKIEL